jgi:two-component system alkaline phosphatase synthesis response regulator PhoP
MNLILVADDDEDILTLMSVSMERAGHEVLAARDGEEALDLALDRQPDLVLLDVAMPHLTGFEVLRRIRATRAQVPVILVSAFASEEDIAAGRQEGANDYIVKPFSPDDLFRRAAAVLAGARGAPALSVG